MSPSSVQLWDLGDLLHHGHGERRQPHGGRCELPDGVDRLVHRHSSDQPAPPRARRRTPRPVPIRSSGSTTGSGPGRLRRGPRPLTVDVRTAGATGRCHVHDEHRRHQPDRQRERHVGNLIVQANGPGAMTVATYGANPTPTAPVGATGVLRRRGTRDWLGILQRVDRRLQLRRRLVARSGTTGPPRSGSSSRPRRSRSPASSPRSPADSSPSLSPARRDPDRRLVAHLARRPRRATGWPPATAASSPIDRTFYGSTGQHHAEPAHRRHGAHP